MQIGLGCRITRNSDGSISAVEAPNGNPSILYRDALRVAGNPEAASDIWSVAYTKGYADYIGMKVQDIASEANVDENGEPLLNDVMDYLSVKSSVSGNYTKEEMADVNDFITSSGFKSLDNLYDRMSMLYDGGLIVFTKERLVSSGIWSEAEAERIMNDPVISFQAKESIRRFMDYYSSPEESQGYYMADVSPDVRVPTDEYTSFGTRKMLDPAVVSNGMKESLAGITDRTAFDTAVNSLPYQEIIERYNEDAGYAESVYSRYSSLSRIPMVDSSGNPVSGISYGFRTFVRPAGRSEFEKADKTMDDLLMTDSEKWNAEPDEIISKLKELEMYAAGMGMDISGLSDMYGSGTREEIIPFLSDLMVFSRRIQTTDFSEYDKDAFLSSRERLFGPESQDYRIEALSENLRGLDLVYMISGIPSDVAFRDMGLLSVNGHPGVYQRVDNGVSKDDIYELLYRAETDKDARVGIIPSGALKSVTDKDGISTSRLMDPKNKENVIRDIASYVRSRMLPGDTEQMAAYRVAFRHPDSESGNASDIRRSLDRYLEGGRSVNTYSLESDIYYGLLKMKASDMEAYEDVFGGVGFYPSTGISLRHSDAGTLRMMDLAMEDGLRDNFKKYALNSKDPSLFDMFYLKRRDMGEADEGFYREYYQDNPGALPESRGHANKVSDRITGIAGEFSNFVRIGNSVYEKMGEYEAGSLYAETGTDKTGLSEETGFIAESMKGSEVSDAVSITDGVSRNSNLSRRLEC